MPTSLQLSQLLVQSLSALAGKLLSLVLFCFCRAGKITLIWFDLVLSKVEDSFQGATVFLLSPLLCRVNCFCRGIYLRRNEHRNKIQMSTNQHTQKLDSFLIIQFWLCKLAVKSIVRYVKEDQRIILSIYPWGISFFFRLLSRHKIRRLISMRQSSNFVFIWLRVNLKIPPPTQTNPTSLSDLVSEFESLCVET